MPSSDAAKPDGRRRPWRTAALVLAVVAALLVATWAVFPWVVGALAPGLAATVGVERLHLAVGRPGTGTMAVDALELVSGRLHLSARGGQITYDPWRLLRGRLDAVRFGRVTVRLEAGNDGPDDAAGAAPDPPAAIEAAFAAVPAERLTVDTLELEVAAAGFRARGSLRLDRQQLAAHLEGLAPAEAERFTADVTLGADGRVAVRIAEEAADAPRQDADARPLLTVTSRLGDDAVTADAEVHVRGFALDLAAALAGLTPAAGRVDGTLSASVPWPLPGDWRHSVTAQGRLALDWKPEHDTWSVSDAEVEWRLDHGSVVADGRGAVTQGGRRFGVRAVTDGYSLKTGTGAGTLVVSDGSPPAPADRPGEHPLADLSWTLEARALQVSGAFRVAGALLDSAAAVAGLPPGDGVLRGELTTRLPWPLPESWQTLRPPSNGTFQGHWRAAHGDLAVTDGQGAWRLENDDLSGGLDAALHHRGLTLPVALELASATLQDDRLAARGVATLGGTLKLPFHAKHHLSRADGSVSVDGELAIDAALAEALVEGWDRPYDVTAGTVSFAGELGWDGEGPGTGRLRLDLDGLGGHYQDYLASGVIGSLTFAAQEAGGWTLQPAALELARVDTGIELTDVDTGVAWSGDRLQVQPTTAQLLGGTARTDAFDYGIDSGSADFRIHLADLSVERILALEGEQISGTGSVDGTLPVQLRGNVASVEGGRVRSDPPGGVIRVSSALAGGTGQPGLDFALRALQDFRYSLLQADVAYSPSGDLTLGLRLEGRNPEIEGGRPIHYNVTVNENLPVLLQSLRLQDQLTREIERRVTE